MDLQDDLVEIDIWTSRKDGGRQSTVLCVTYLKVTQNLNPNRSQKDILFFRSNKLKYCCVPTFQRFVTAEARFKGPDTRPSDDAEM